MSEVRARVRRVLEKSPGCARTYETTEVVFPCTPQVSWYVGLRSMDKSTYDHVRYFSQATIEAKWTEVEGRISRIGTDTHGEYEGALWIDLEEVA